jgi:type II restriction enzyme
MNLHFNTNLAIDYKNNSQKIRVLSESWVDQQIYCPNCGKKSIDNYECNKPVADFYCSNCKEDYELKSKKDNVGNKIVDGAYRTMIERLNSNNNPNFFFLSYDSRKYKVINFLVIPKHFFVPKIIEKRKPLPPTAKRAGWVGCNIILKDIPEAGRIYYVKNHISLPKQKVINSWQKTEFLRQEKDNSAKGWLLDTMRIIDKLGKSEFTLDEIYSFEKDLSQQYPHNRHIKDKLRQQLQILRDKGFLKFVSRGHYKLS